MSKRYKYDQLNAVQLRAALNGLDMPYMEFCRLTGANERTVKKWLDGEQDIPSWAWLLLDLFKNQTDAIAKAQDWAATTINSDLQQPGVTYPYR